MFFRSIMAGLIRPVVVVLLLLNRNLFIILCYFFPHLNVLVRHIRSFIPKSAAITFTNAFIHFRLDYCNSLLNSLPKYSLHRLQKLQNSVTCIVTRTSRSSHITPIFKSLHWLPVHVLHNLSCTLIKGTSLFKFIAYSQIKSTFSSLILLLSH